MAGEETAARRWPGVLAPPGPPVCVSTSSCVGVTHCGSSWEDSRVRRAERLLMYVWSGVSRSWVARHGQGCWAYTLPTVELQECARGAAAPSLFARLGDQ